MKRILSALVFLALWPPATYADRAVVDGPTHDGVEVACELPNGEHMKNVGGRDGAGLCVFTSIEHSGRFQNVPALRGFQQHMRQEPGGGYPEKVDAMMKKYAPGVPYVQYSGNDPAVLDLAIRTGRMPGVTYGYGERYGGRIAHMVNLVALTDKAAAILDNNFPGTYEWMSRDEFLRRWKMGGGGWAVVLLAPPPPPVPVNRDRAREVPLNPALLARGFLSLASWGTGGCYSGGGLGPVGPSWFQTRPLSSGYSGYEWVQIPDSTQQALYYYGVQIGAWDYARDVYRAYDARTGSWGPVCEPPWGKPEVRDFGVKRKQPLAREAEPPKPKEPKDEPKPEEPKPPEVKNFGVELDLIPAGEFFSRNGKRVYDREEALRVISDGGALADDASKLRVTVVGTEAECLQVSQDLAGHPALAPFKDKVLFQCYRPDHWAVRDAGLPAAGHPTIVVQEKPDAAGKGRVLWHQDDYAGGAEALAAALRKADPNYDPNKDPGPKNPEGPGGVPLWAWAAGFVGLVLFLPSKKKRKR